MQQLLCTLPFTFRVRMVKIPSHWWTLGNLCICVCACSFSCVRFFVTLWTVASQGPLSMGFSRQEYWSGLPFPSPGDLPDPGIKPASSALASGFFTTKLQVSLCLHAKSLQSCPILCDPMDCSLPGSSVHGILQTRILEWVAMPSSRGSS